jgi:hypothetical protein
MIIAALILSIMALIIAIACLVWLLAKHYSTHQIQLVSADTYAPLAKPIGADMQEIDQLRDDANDPFSRI